MHRAKVHMGMELTEAKDTLKHSIWGQLTEVEHSEVKYTWRQYMHRSRVHEGNVHIEVERMKAMYT